MPFYQRIWNTLLDEQTPSSGSSSKKIVRWYPAFSQQEKKDEESAPSPAKPIHVDLIRLTAIQNKLSQQVKELLDKGAVGAAPAATSPEFANYRVTEGVAPIFNGLHSSIRQCTNSAHFGDLVMIVREFKPTSLLKPDDMYLKLLRAIGRKSQYIIQTMDCFVDWRGHIFLIQEYGLGGNAFEWSRAHILTEGQMLNWAQTVAQAMSFLGDMGIAHRSIQPKHLLLKRVPGATDPSEAIRVKLSGFRDAIIYWDAATRDIIDQPCLPAAARTYAYFQAPEVFASESSAGANPPPPAAEFFDPLKADLWSLGATMFYMVAGIYPYNVRQPESHLDGEIRNAIAACEAIHDAAKYWLYGLMRPNTKLRYEFDEAVQDTWFQGDDD